MKNTFQQASELRGQSLLRSSWMTYERTLETIAAENILQLSARDSEAFALAAPKRPPLMTPSSPASSRTRSRTGWEQSTSSTQSVPRLSSPSGS